MINFDTTIWENNINQQFAKSLVDIVDIKIMENFLRDVMTEKEITEISSRLEAARMLQLGKKYTEIINVTKLSSRTVARISDWMNNGCKGYIKILNKTNHKDHIKPVSAV